MPATPASPYPHVFRDPSSVAEIPTAISDPKRKDTTAAGVPLTNVFATMVKGRSSGPSHGG